LKLLFNNNISANYDYGLARFMIMPNEFVCSASEVDFSRI